MSGASPEPMPKLKLTIACGDYDRTRALSDGTVQPEGTNDRDQA